MARTSTVVPKKTGAAKSGSRAVVRVAPTKAEANQRLAQRGGLWSKLGTEQKGKALNVKAREVSGPKR